MDVHEWISIICIAVIIFGLLILASMSQKISDLYDTKVDEYDFKTIKDTVCVLSDEIIRIYQMMNVYQYKRKFSDNEEIVSAIQLTPTNKNHVLAFLNKQGTDHYLADNTEVNSDKPPELQPYFIEMFDTGKEAHYSDYIVKDSNGRCYAFSQSTFNESFERIYK